MTRSKIFLAIAAMCAALSGCAPNIENKDAVKKGIVEYFQKKSGAMGLNLDQMAIEVVSVEFHNKEATATVAFRPKQATTNDAPMQMVYVLEQKGGKWEVKGRPSAGSDTHAPGTEGTAPPPVSPGATLPPNHPPTGAPAGAAPALPPNHPPTGAPPSLPPNHPPIDPKAQGKK